MQYNKHERSFQLQLNGQSVCAKCPFPKALLRLAWSNLARTQQNHSFCSNVFRGVSFTTVSVCKEPLRETLCDGGFRTTPKLASGTTTRPCSAQIALFSRWVNAVKIGGWLETPGCIRHGVLPIMTANIQVLYLIYKTTNSTTKTKHVLVSLNVQWIVWPASPLGAWFETPLLRFSDQTRTRAPKLTQEIEWPVSSNCLARTRAQQTLSPPPSDAFWPIRYLLFPQPLTSLRSWQTTQPSPQASFRNSDPP